MQSTVRLNKLDVAGRKTTSRVLAKPARPMPLDALPLGALWSSELGTLPVGTWIGFELLRAQGGEGRTWVEGLESLPPPSTRVGRLVHRGSSSVLGGDSTNTSDVCPFFHVRLNTWRTSPAIRPRLHPPFSYKQLDRSTLAFYSSEASTIYLLPTAGAPRWHRLLSQYQ